MRIILSRKGMDSENGGIPSPIIEGKLIPLPIPTDKSPVRFSALKTYGLDIGRIVADLSRDPHLPNRFAHVDPDLVASTIPRLNGWRPTFGQTAAAASHLRRYGVTVGDLFLFFGWFREAELANGKYRFKKDAPDLHVLFGWLQVGAMVSCDDSVAQSFTWAADHPHFAGRYGTAYIAMERLNLDGWKPKLNGGGAFAEYRDALCLTCPNQSKRSLWRMPNWCFPNADGFSMTYHRKAACYAQDGNFVKVQTAAKGQEFIINTESFPKALRWARQIISSGTS